MSARVRSFISKILGNPPDPLPTTQEIGESSIGKIFSPELFITELKDQGYDLDILIDKEGKILRITKFMKNVANENGDVW